jgi:hypothetical protein
MPELVFMSRRVGEMVDACKIEIFCIEKSVIERCDLYKRRVFLHTVHQKFWPSICG